MILIWYFNNVIYYAFSNKREENPLFLVATHNGTDTSSSNNFKYGKIKKKVLGGI